MFGPSLWMSVLSACKPEPEVRPDPVDPTDPSTTSGTTELVPGCTFRVEGPPLVRVPVGAPRALPVSDDEGCRDLRWAVADAPGDNEVVDGADGPRFVPDVPGTWTFALGDVATLEVEVVAEAPFHNLFHPPSRSLAAVGDEVWVAQGYAPSVARLAAADLSPRGEVRVGSWPVALAATPDGGTVLVAQAGDDHLGVIDVASGRTVDAIPVCDEPSGVVVSPDGGTAYVASATSGEVAVVDLAARARIGTLPAPPDARAMALSSDGAVLYVAGHRTGAPSRYPYGDDERATDILAVDTASGAVVATFPEVASTITDLELDEAGGRLLVSGTVSHPERGLVDLGSPPFEAVVSAWSLDDGAPLGSATLGPDAPGAGVVLGPQALARAGDALWVVAEGSSVAVSLAFDTLAETARVPVEGHPRDALVIGDRLLVHGSQSFQVSAVEAGAVVGTGAAGVDPRPADVADGQRGFVSPGATYGVNYSCNSCHVDGRGDTRVWPAGPFEVWEASRAMFWLEGTAPLGWSGYVVDARTFGYTGYTSIIAKWPTVHEAESLGGFLASLMPPAAANDWTTPSGALSEAGRRGRAVFEDAACAACHPGPIATDNATLEEGLTPDRSSTPSLVGVYRHNVWLKRADVSSLRDATVAALEALGNDRLSETQIDDLTRYLAEATDRDLFLLARTPLADATAVGADAPIRLTFNQPVWDAAPNRSRFHLRVDGAEVGAAVTFDGRYATIAPDAPLPPGASVEVVVDGGLEAFDGRVSTDEERFSFVTAAAPALALDGTYELVVDLPAIDFVNGGFDPGSTLPIRSELLAVATRDGATLDLDLGRGLRWAMAGVVEGDALHLPAFPLSFGFSMAQGQAVVATLVDEDADGVADAASGTLRMTGPGFDEEGVAFTIRRPRGCEPGVEGSVPVSVTVGAGGEPVVDWGAAGAIGLYVTDPGANLPVGPGTVVSNGAAYWVLEAANFPLGFDGPVTYGEVPRRAADTSPTHGAPVGGAPLVPGACYTFSVVTDRFQTGSATLVWE